MRARARAYRPVFKVAGFTAKEARTMAREVRDVYTHLDRWRLFAET